VQERPKRILPLKSHNACQKAGQTQSLLEARIAVLVSKLILPFKVGTCALVERTSPHSKRIRSGRGQMSEFHAAPSPRSRALSISSLSAAVELAVRSRPIQAETVRPV